MARNELSTGSGRWNPHIGYETLSFGQRKVMIDRSKCAVAPRDGC